MNAIDLLKRDIVKYIYDQGWPALRPIQEAAIKHAHESKSNLILAAPTASGKTEAAFIPAINEVDDWTKGVKIVYISPLIALINDQFKRITELCEYMDIPVTSWHGEASQTEKKNLIKNPRGILLITPESIEAMLTHRPGEAGSLFADVEWVIVDELHSFLESTRGVHVKSLLGRTAALAKHQPRCIGMTATLNRNSYTIAKNFFTNNRDASVLLDSAKNNLTSTILYEQSDGSSTPANIIDEIFKYSNQESMLVFPNARGRVEEIAVGLKRRANKQKNHTRYFAHHASVDKELRLEAEEFAKTSTYQLFTICCTSTLELGIDIGAVDSVSQVEAAPSVASLAQRLGRSGRMKRHSILHLFASKDWSLLQSLACLQLYQDGIVEEIAPIRKPYGVLIQQILSILLQFSGLDRATLVHKLILLRSWVDITDDEINRVLDHLITIDYVEDVDGVLITGMGAQRCIESRDFYAHFDTKVEFRVIHSHEHIGELPLSMETIVGANIYLAANIWKIKDIDLSSKKIFVVSAHDGKPPIFGGDAGDVSHLVRRKMLSILHELSVLDQQYDKNIMDTLRKLAKESLSPDGIDFFISPTSKKLQTITTFAGSKLNRTILLFLLVTRDENHEASDFKLDEFNSSITAPNLREYFNLLCRQPLTSEDIAIWLSENEKTVNELLMGGRYLDLLPRELQINYLIHNYFDVNMANHFIADYRL